MDAARTTMNADIFESVPFVRAAALSPGGCLLAVADDTGVRVWDLAADVSPVDLAGSPQRVRSLAFSPDGSHVAAGGADGRVIVWAASGARVTDLSGPNHSFWTVGWNPSGKSVAAAAEGGELFLWDIGDGRELVRLTSDDLSQGGRPSTVRSHAFIDNRNLIVALHSGAVVQWDLEGPRPTRVLRAGEGGRPIRAVAVSSGQVAAGDNKGVLYLRGESTAALILAEHVGAIVAIAFQPGGRLVATGGDDRTVRVWDSVTGRLLRVLRGLNGQILAVEFTPDGSELVACDGDAVVARWAVSNGRLRLRVRCRRHIRQNAQRPQESRAWQLEAMRYDWETIRCGCPRGARHVPGSFADLVRAQTEDEARGRGLVNDVEIQGMLFEAAVPVTSMIIAALAEEQLSIPARQRLLDLLASFVDGESYHTEALEGRPHLERECRERARDGLVVLNREMEQEQIPGGAPLVADIIDSINEE